MRRGITRQWSKDQQAFWDHALSASSALRSALLQKLLIEHADLHNVHWSLVLWDLTKFYDTICLATLMQQARLRFYPLRLTYLLVSLYVGDRVISSENDSNDSKISV